MVSKKRESQLLRLLYASFLGKIVRPLLKRKWFSVLAGYYANSSMSRRHISSFIKNFSIDTQEFEHDSKTYRSFNAFFVRTLKSSVRPIDRDDAVLVSPADSAALVVNQITEEAIFSVKGSEFNLKAFLADPVLGREYTNGTLLIFRLAPWDYHRYHFPTSCVPAVSRRIRGYYDSVNPIVYNNGLQPLHENERQRITLRTVDFSEILMVPVGALCVGKITHTYEPGKRHEKGDEMGYFSFGGSTLVMVCKPGIVEVSDEILTNSKQGKETIVKMGQAVARKI